MAPFFACLTVVVERYYAVERLRKFLILVLADTLYQLSIDKSTNNR